MSKAPMPDSAHGDTPMPSSFDEDLEFWDEGRWAKLGRRLKEEPLIPLGLALTCYALYGATRSIRRGDKERTNQYFRARVYAQGFTLLCVCVGAIYWKEDRDKRKYYAGLLGEKRAQEKKEAWIRELEAREREDQIERERRAARKKEIIAAAAAAAPSPTSSSSSNTPATTSSSTPPQKPEVVPGDEAKRNAEPRNTSPLTGTELREILVGSRILGPALMAWWSRGEGES